MGLINIKESGINHLIDFFNTYSNYDLSPMLEPNTEKYVFKYIEWEKDVSKENTYRVRIMNSSFDKPVNTATLFIDSEKKEYSIKIKGNVFKREKGRETIIMVLSKVLYDNMDDEDKNEIEKMNREETEYFEYRRNYKYPKRYRIGMRILTFLYFLCFIISFAIIIIQPHLYGISNLKNLFYLFGLIFLEVSSLIFIGNIISMRMDRIPEDIKRYEADIIDYIPDSKNKDMITSVYRCRDESGRAMFFHSKDNIRVSKEEYERLLNKAYTHDYEKEVIWANEEWGPDAYEDRDNAPYIDKSDNKTNIIINLIFIVVSAAVVAFCLITNKPASAEYEELKYEFSSTMHDSDLVYQNVKKLDTVKWITTATSFYANLEGGEADELGAHSNHDWSGEDMKEYLSDMWGIENRKDIIDTLNKFCYHGTRSKFHERVQEYIEDGIFVMDENTLNINTSSPNYDKEKKKAYENMCKAYNTYGENAIDAWDYIRMMRITGLCYHVGYLNLEETLNQSLNFAKELQKSYKNWNEVFDSYYMGYCYWHDDFEDESHARYKRAINKSKINASIPYETELTKEW